MAGRRSARQHGARDVAVDEARGDEFVLGHELVRLMCNRQGAWTDDHTLGPGGPEVDQVAAALEAERSRLFDAMTAGRVEAANNDRPIGSSLGRRPGGRLPFEDLGPYAKALPSHLEQRGDLASDG